ncbi:hypothetical protein BJ085DRAFT_34805 [Dimargaris cristalligena]|uniref:Uncharacterized protein n=1 Tax=Dimargaris cristalligena TaxID=215637 RepID=A0A4P9ZKT4_9FUNG|nr:hypothetical protein BJ085DRAFT_34805 [Dimargaris cristalligena]|eukprot:RKP33182.1 hypothetical protein BJ085DRAFT_34805 [Dimargaris cristalligena]
MADQNTSGDFPKATSVSTPPNPAKPNVPHYMTKYGEPSSGKKPEIPPPANSPKGTPAESLKFATAFYMGVPSFVVKKC